MATGDCQSWGGTRGTGRWRRGRAPQDLGQQNLLWAVTQENLSLETAL